MNAVINIYVNNQLRQWTPDVRTKDLLEAINITSFNGIALAVNNNVIPKAEWEGYLFKDGDKVTVIKATQGG